MPTVRCPICGKTFDPAQSESMPFCSQRCQRIDLSRWLDERYLLPIEREEDADEGNPPEGDK